MANEKLVSKLLSYLPLLASQLLGRGLGAFKDVLIAFFLGISLYTDAYFLFLAIPGYLVTLFAMPIMSLIVPELAPLDFKTRKAYAWGYSKLFMKLSTIVLFILFALGTVYLNFFGPQTSQFEFTCFFVMCSVLPFSCCGQVLSSYLSLNKDYKNLAAITVVNPLTSFVTFLMLINVFDYWALPMSFAAGFLVEGVVAFIYLKVVAKNSEVIFSAFNTFYKEYRALIFSAVFLGSATIIDNFMIFNTGVTGGVTSYSFGTKLVAVLLSLSLFPINQVLFPMLSSLYAKPDGQIQFKELYLKSIGAIFLYGGAAILGFYFFGGYVLKAFYLRGKVNEGDLSLITQIFFFYGLQVPFYLAGVLAAKVLSVFRLNRFLLYISIASLFLNIALNYIFIKLYGVSGVALATSVVYLVSFMFMVATFLIKCRGEAR